MTSYPRPLVAFFIFIFIFVHPVVADEAADSLASTPIEEIIVTADFRGRTVTDVPASVTVLDRERLTATSVQHFEELVDLVPNMNWSGDGHRARYFQLRGIGELEQYQGAPNPSVGFLIDDIDFSGIGTVATLFDIEAVEVLRGAQGSRYGANALAGLIYVRSATPSIERKGQVELTVADDDALSLGAAWGGAINRGETVTVRVSAQKYASNGFRDNPFLGRDDTNARDESLLRARLRFDPNTDFVADLAVMVSDIDNGYDAFALDNGYTVLSDKPGRDAQRSVGTSLRMDWDAVANGTLSSVTTFADSDIDFGFDADWGNAVSWFPFTYDFTSAQQRTRQTVSQEVRYNTDSWILGMYAQRLNEDLWSQDSGRYLDPSDPLSEFALNPPPFLSDYESTSIAMFGQYEYAWSAATEVSAGLRVERRTTNYNDSDALRTGPSEVAWGGELSVRHQWDERRSVYATASKGYKAGGFNLGPAPDGRRDFGAEALWTVEFGLKSTYRDDSLRWNAAVFVSRREDQQVRSSEQLVPGDPASFVFFTDNIGRGDIRGFESDLTWDLSDQWQWYANIGWLHTEVDSGRAAAHAPRYTFASGIAYQTDDGYFARFDVTAKDEFFFDVSHDQKSASYALVNTRIGYDGENWSWSVWSRNLFDKNYAVRGFFFGNEPPAFIPTLYTRLGDPRQVGLTIKKRF